MISWLSQRALCSTSPPAKCLSVCFGTLLLCAILASPAGPAFAQLPAADSVASPAAHLPLPDLSTFALKTGEQYHDCPRLDTTHEADCMLQEVVFNSAQGDGYISQAARRTNMTVSGPGLSIGNLGGWRVHKVNVDIFNIGSRGISQARSLVMYKHAAGDTMGTYDYVYSDGGSTALSDEAIKGYAADIGETTGYFHGSIASTTGTGDTAPALAFAFGNNWTTDGAPLLDISQGSIAGHFTGRGSVLDGSSNGRSSLGTAAVDNNLPLSTAWGICGQEIPNNHQVESSSFLVCNVALKFGRFHAGGLVCVAGPNYPEQAPITAVGEPSSGFQSITVSVRNPNQTGANIFQGGVCGQYISFDANLAASGYRSSYYAFGALDPHHLIFGMNVIGNVENGLPMASEAERFGVEGLNGYHLYPGCEVITNRSIKADPTCEPNSVPWAAGDLVEAPHNVAVNTVGHFVDLTQNTPANGSLSSVELLQFHGPGAVGNNFIARRTRNANAYQMFKVYGGLFDPPDLHRVEGYFNAGLSFNIAPITVVRIFGNADHSNAVMNLFAMPGGDITWDPATATLQAPKIKAQNFAGLRGTSERIGGAPLALGSCATGLTNIPGATLNMIPTTVASTIGAPGFSAQGAFQITAQVTAPDQVTVNVCALIAGTPKQSNYIVALE